MMVPDSSRPLLVTNLVQYCIDAAALHKLLALDSSHAALRK